MQTAFLGDAGVILVLIGSFFYLLGSIGEQLIGIWGHSGFILMLSGSFYNLLVLLG